MKKRAMTILSPTAILGYGFPLDSFKRGMARRPDMIAVDAGSTDPGPYYLGAGKSFTDRACVERDLSILLPAALSAGIPLVIGTAGGCGAAPHVAWCRDIIKSISHTQGLQVRLGIIHSDVPRDAVIRALEEDRIQALPGAPELTVSAIQRTTRIVAQMGHPPIMTALAKSCQVVLAGRCYDPAVFAALPIARGFDPGLALHLGKILECAAIAATPGSGSDCVLGILEADGFRLEALSEARRFTAESTAAHTLYEKSDPAHLKGPGGVLNLSGCTFTQEAGGQVTVRGARFEPCEPYRIKLEGAAPVGFRTISVAGIRDPIMIANIDDILASLRARLADAKKEQGLTGELHLHVYGKNGVMEQWEPVHKMQSHELGLVLEAVAPTQQGANTMCSMARATLLHYGYPGRIATAGNLAFPFSPSDIPMGQAYEFSVYHLMTSPPEAFFPVTVETINGETGTGGKG